MAKVLRARPVRKQADRYHHGDLPRAIKNMTLFPAT